MMSIPLLSDVAAYHMFVCALFPVQGGVWTENKMHDIYGIKILQVVFGFLVNTAQW